MNVFLIGGPGSLTNAIISKLNKEGHKVFLLSGDKHTKRRHFEKVFAYYPFSYDNVYMKDIFESVNPDVTIHLGALDSNFQWLDEQQDSSRYMSGLSMLLSVFQAYGRGRYIYLSSGDVFESSYYSDIMETAQPDGYTSRAVALASAERLVSGYASAGADVLTLRMDKLCHVPTDIHDVNDVCSQMCLQAVRTGKVEWHPDQIFSVIPEPDAVEFIYHMLVIEKHQHQLYHLSAGEALDEQMIAECIEKSEVVPVKLEKSYTADTRKHVLSNRFYRSEFGLQVRNTPASMIRKILKYMTANPRLFGIKQEKQESGFSQFMKKALWVLHKFVPYIENLIVFVLIFFAQNSGFGSQYLGKLDIYLLYVLLFSIFYGQQQAVVAGVLSVLGYCYTQMQLRTGLQVMADYNTYIWMAQLFIIGLVVGYMRDVIRKQRDESFEERGYLNERIGDMQVINYSNVRVKDALETQIVNQSDTIGKIYRITSSLNQYTPEEVLFYAAEIVEQLMDTGDVAIYMVDNEIYARLFTATSERARSLGNSIKYAMFEEIAEALSQHSVYINRKLNKDYPLMACGVYAEENLQSIIFVWGLPWERMTLGQANILTVTSLMIRDFVVRAQKYMEQLDHRYAENCHVLEPEAFETEKTAYENAARRHLTEYRLLEVMERRTFAQKDYEKLNSLVRHTDIVGHTSSGKLAIILSNTNGEAMKIVMKRLAENGFDCKELLEQ